MLRQVAAATPAILSLPKGKRTRMAQKWPCIEPEGAVDQNGVCVIKSIHDLLPTEKAVYKFRRPCSSHYNEPRYYREITL